MNPDLFPETLLVKLDHDHAFTTSLKVAEHFGKRHDHVLRASRELFSEINGLKNEGIDLPNGPNFGAIDTPDRRLNFQPSIDIGHEATYLDSRGRAKPMYHLSRDGFSLLAMGFTGKEALVWKIKFLEAFNVMEAELHAKTARYAAALDQVRPLLRPVVEATQQGQSRAAIAQPLGKSAASVSYHRSSARRLGLLAPKVTA